MSVTFKNQLGRGGLGTVYRCVDSTSTDRAVKVSHGKNVGVPCLVEASIMASYRHPHINSARMIIKSPTHLYLIQDLAVSDLFVWRQHNEPTSEQIKQITHSMINGCVFLHHEGIVHGDIKSMNVLIYPDQSIKITDFTLSTIRGIVSDRSVCTTTHRPLEVWKNNKIDEKSDIWALGCTVFEIVYGYSLFRYQGSDSDTCNRSINAIIDWYDSGFGGDIDPNTPKSCVEYLPPELPKTWIPSESINKFVLKMLKVDPTQRLTSSVLLGDEYFNDCEYHCTDPSDNTLRLYIDDSKYSTG